MSKYAKNLAKSKDFNLLKSKPDEEHDSRPDDPKSRPGDRDDEQKPVRSRPTKELTEDPPPLSDAPTGKIPIVDRRRRKAS